MSIINIKRHANDLHNYIWLNLYHHRLISVNSLNRNRLQCLNESALTVITMLSTHFYLINGFSLLDFLKIHNFSIPAYVISRHKNMFNPYVTVIKFNNRLKLEQNNYTRLCRIIRYPRMLGK